MGRSEEERDKLGPVRERGERHIERRQVGEKIAVSWKGRRAAPCGNSGRG